MKILGVVILNYKTHRDTLRLVRDLLSFEMREEMQIVVVDNLSPNESFDILKHELEDEENVEVIQSGYNGGYAKGNNIGLRALKKYDPKYALILNNDVYFSEKTLKNCIESYNIYPNIGQISPLQLLPNNQIANLGNLKCNNLFEDILCHFVIYNRLKKRTPIKYVSNTTVNNLRMVDIIPGCFVFINYKLFESIGFYDEETFLFCEERFLYRKLIDRGYCNYLIINDGYIHDHSLTIRSELDTIRIMKFFNDGQIAYTKKYRKWALPLSVILKLAFYYSCIEFKIINALKKVSR